MNQKQKHDDDLLDPRFDEDERLDELLDDIWQMFSDKEPVHAE